MMADGRLPAHIEVAAILRMAESAGGFAAVIEKGERDAGTILLITICRGKDAELYERMPQHDGSRRFVLSKNQGTENEQEFSSYLQRRKTQDRDIWILEADVPDRERFVASLPG